MKGPFPQPWVMMCLNTGHLFRCYCPRMAAEKSVLASTIHPLESDQAVILTRMDGVADLLLNRTEAFARTPSSGISFAKALGVLLRYSTGQKAQ